MAWSFRSQVRGHRIRDEGSTVTQSSKVRAEKKADAGGALGVVWRRTEVAHPLFLQAAGVAARLRGCVVAGRSGVAAGHVLEGTREDGAGGARQAGESPPLGHRLAGRERESLDGELCVLARGPPR